MADASLRQFDLIVIGSGPGGYKSAVIAAQKGAKVVLVEKAQLGGTCLNQGCVPKETLVKLARVIQNAKNLSGSGITAEIRGDFTAAMAHQSSVVNSIRGTVLPWLRQLGVRVLQGHASFIDANTLIVEGTDQTYTIAAPRIIIATGSKPKQHPHCPTDGVHVLNSRDFMFNLTTLPESMLFVGGGAIGCEIGFLLHQFGCKTTIIDSSTRLLEKGCIPSRAGSTLERKLIGSGVSVHTGVTVARTEIKENGVNIELSDGTRAVYEKVLVAIGREANTDELKIQNAKIKLDADGFIRVNEFLETSQPGIYAVGDVKRGPMTATAAFHDAKIAAENALTGNKIVSNYNRVPIVIDSALPIASVGLTPERAEEAGFEPDVARINLAATTIARINNDPEGYIEVVHDEETGQLLGGNIVGQQAGEMIHLLTAACQSERGLWFFTDINYSHPSWNEELENAIGRCISEFNRSPEPLFKPGIYAR